MNQYPERHVAVLSPWYPEPQIPYAGAFVEAMVGAVAPGLDRVDVYHLHNWVVSGGEDRRRPVWDLHARLLPRSVPPAATVGGATLWRIPSLVPRTKQWAVHAENYAHWLRTALGGEPIEAPVIHAHVPMVAAWAALENCRPDARVFATEHSSFLAGVLEQPEARALYDQILERCAGFFVVGESLDRLISRTFPHHAGKIQYIANPIDFGARRAEPPTALRRWVSVAGLKEGKRTDHLLRAFAVCRAEDPELTLTIAGDGKMRAALEALCDELGVREAVTFLGMVEPKEVPGIMAAHDLLVHPSAFETFGVVVVEAIAAGVPVLVTRCGGPEKVLEGVEDAAGLLVDVEDDPQVLVEGYRALRERHPEKTDLDRAREHLRSKYSYESVADRYYRSWYGQEEGR
jgi:glycosyltransferase involved in cell wall biosynthesis